ncbi:MAG: zinc ABC transporter substrate-binding protein [Gemmataceae bacterium]|nr:zinc ABC transporter substrate-binding protein [Gemmataceae bacterium]
MTIEKTFAGTYPVKAVATTGMVADLVRNVGGTHVAVTQLFGADVDPHLYKATDGDTAKLAAADVIFYSGLHLEGKMTDIFESLSRNKPCVGVAENLDARALLHDDDGAIDPHVWFDVSLWSQAAGVVREALARFDPPHAADYEANCARYQRELAELHAWVRARMLEVPQTRRVLITSHDAFRYFGRAYATEVMAIQGISTESEASVGRISALVDVIVRRKIKAVFVESSVSPRNMRALIEGCAARGHTVVEGGQLCSDAMGQEGTPEGTYVGMIRHNVNTIVNSLK